MSEQLRHSKERLTTEDVLRPLRRCYVARSRLEDWERQRTWLEAKVIGNLAVVGARHRGYQLDQELIEEFVEVDPETAQTYVQTYANLMVQLFSARDRVPRYIAGLEQGLARRLQPKRGLVPVLQVQNRGIVEQSGEAVQGDTAQREYRDLGFIREHGRIDVISGECVEVAQGHLYIATNEAIFRVNPLDKHGQPNPDVTLTVEYPY
jgi:hypothetical protein